MDYTNSLPSLTKSRSTMPKIENYEKTMHIYSKKHVKNPLVEIYKIKFLKDLFKNNVSIYGAFVREVFINQVSVSEYLDKCKYIHGYVVNTYRQIIERDLHEYISSIKTYNTLSSLYNCVIYSLHIQPYSEFNLIMYYSRTTPVNIQKTIKIGVDINLLTLNRLGLGLVFIPKIYTTSPIPLYEVLTNIKEKKFIILEDNIDKNNTTIEYVQSLLRSFWCNINCSIIDVPVSNITNDDQCGICLDLLKNKSLIQVTCQHIYHKDCWIKHLDNFIKGEKYLNDNIKCPMCRNEFSLWEVLIQPYNNY